MSEKVRMAARLAEAERSSPERTLYRKISEETPNTAFFNACICTAPRRGMFPLGFQYNARFYHCPSNSFHEDKAFYSPRRIFGKNKTIQKRSPAPHSRTPFPSGPQSSGLFIFLEKMNTGQTMEPEWCLTWSGVVTCGKQRLNGGELGAEAEQLRGGLEVLGGGGGRRDADVAVARVAAVRVGRACGGERHAGRRGTSKRPSWRSRAASRRR